MAVKSARLVKPFPFWHTVANVRRSHIGRVRAARKPKLTSSTSGSTYKKLTRVGFLPPILRYRSPYITAYHARRMAVTLSAPGPVANTTLYFDADDADDVDHAGPWAGAPHHAVL